MRGGKGEREDAQEKKKPITKIVFWVCLGCFFWGFLFLFVFFVCLLVLFFFFFWLFWFPSHPTINGEEKYHKIGAICRRGKICERGKGPLDIDDIRQGKNQTCHEGLMHAWPAWRKVRRRGTKRKVAGTKNAKTQGSKVSSCDRPRQINIRGGLKREPQRKEKPPACQQKKRRQGPVS